MLIPSYFVNHPVCVSPFKENVEYVLLGGNDRGRMGIHRLPLNLCLCTHVVLRWTTWEKAHWQITHANKYDLPKFVYSPFS